MTIAAFISVTECETLQQMASRDIQFLLKPGCRLQFFHGNTFGSSSHDPAQRDAFPAGAASVVHFRAALPSDARRQFEIKPNVFRSDAEAGPQPRDALSRGGAGIDPGLR